MIKRNALYRFFISTAPAVLFLMLIAATPGGPGRRPVHIGPKKNVPEMRPSPGTPDNVAIVVNGESVSRDDYMKSLYDSFAHRYLKNVINRKLVEQEAKRLGITIDEKELDLEVEKAIHDRARGSGGREGFEEILWQKFKMNMNDFRRNMRRDQRFRLLLMKIVTRRLSTPEKVRELYDRKYGSGAKTSVHALHLITRTEADAKKAVERLNKGEDFRDLAKSEINISDSLRRTCGDEGWFSPGEKYEVVEKAAFELEKGGISPPLKGRFGWHVIQVVDKRAPGSVKLEDVRDEIEKELSRPPSERVFRREVGKILNELNEKAKIEINIHPAPKENIKDKEKTSDAPAEKKDVPKEKDKTPRTPADSNDGKKPDNTPRNDTGKE